MRITAALAWWNESPEDLTACVTAAGRVADRIVAVDGAYRRYPEATVRSDPEQVRAIRRAAKAVGMECVIHQPEELWDGQIAKRTFLLREAAKGSDWIMVLDADHIVHADAGRKVIRQQIAAAGPDVDIISTRFWTPENNSRPLSVSAATSWHSRHSGYTMKMSHLFRAYSDFQVVDRHWVYHVTKNGQPVTLFYGNDQPGPVLENYYVEHRTLFRSVEQVLASRAFCTDREAVMSLTGQEDDRPGLPAPIWSQHRMAPWTDVTFAGVYWNEADRLPSLLKLVRPWFTHLVVGVQESTDGTLEIARRYADEVIEDIHHGFAEATFSKVLAAVRTPWTFVVSGDETPSLTLLGSFQAMLDQVRSRPTTDGFRIKFHSSIDGIDYTNEQDGHLRVFRSDLRWPVTMHSEPQATNVEQWPTGYISHDRTLDEMVTDYLRYYEKGRGDAGWDNHNAMMMREACRGVASHKGWPYVKSFGWWPDVLRIGFSGNEPE